MHIFLLNVISARHLRLIMCASASRVYSGLKNLKVEDISPLFEDKIFERGVRYFEQGRIRRPFVYRDSLMAECQGTLPEDYHIRVDMREGNLVASCTCPYAFGYCKHIAAVLIAWVKKPSAFKDLGRAEGLLRRMDKGSLVEMVLDMVKYDPDVVYVINLRLLPRSELPGFVRREMKSIFSDEYVDYLNVREIVKKLDIFRDYASDIFGEGDPGTAMTVLLPAIEAVIDGYTRLDDVDGLLHNFLSMVMGLYGDIIPAFRMDGERRHYLIAAIDWYVNAEWGLERIVRDFLRRETERLGEEKFMLDSVELKLADFKKSFIAMGPKYTDEYEYVEERLERLEALRTDIKGLF
jgi:hypothetical protein